MKKYLIFLFIFIPSMCIATFTDFATEEIDSGQLNEKLRLLTIGKLDIKPRRIACHNDGFINIDSDTLFIDCTNNRVGIRTGSPDGTLHVITGSAGSVTANVSGDDIVVENSGAGGFSILTASNTSGFYMFGSPTDNSRGFIEYQHNNDLMIFSVAGQSVGALILESDQDVHIQPSGTADVELEVSNGSSTGGGSIHRAASGTHSSRKIKSDITYLTQDIIQQAYNDIKYLKPVTFRYKVKQSTFSNIMIRDTTQPIRRGLILEDVPDSIKKGKAIIIDDRILNLEMAMQILMKKIEILEAQ